VVRLSTGPKARFSFLRDAPGQMAMVLGDARLTLEREPPERFDVLALDAFSSDAIPVHLLTCEAITLYLRHLAPEGMLAVHVSNRYLDLKPVVRGLAGRCRLKALYVESDDDGDFVWSADWILLARDATSFASSQIRDAGVLLSVDDPGLPVWTDAYSNLLGVLKR
jgi:spermidine synthase